LRAALLRARRRPPIVGAGSIAGRRGDGLEFVELRAYQPGDDPRRIDWAATARSGDLQVRILREENALQIAAVVDDSGSMRVGRRRTLLEAANAAAAAWFEMAEIGDRVVRIDGKGLDVLQRLTIAARTLRRGAALLLVSDFHWIEDRSAFVELAVTAARRADVTALIARDPWFDDLPLRGFVRLRDAETARAARVFIGARERARYKEAVRRREEEIRSLLERCGWRTGVLHEDDGRGSLYAAFDL
jgi:uncharacterized protein (DUF58 family)